MLDDLPIQLVQQGINRRIHVSMLRVGEHLPPADMQLGFGDLVQFFYAQHHMNIVDVVKVTLEFGKFVVHIITQSFGDLDWSMRATEAGLRTEVIPDVVLLRRVHGANMSLTKKAQADLERARLLKASLDRRRGRRPGGPS